MMKKTRNILRCLQTGAAGLLSAVLAVGGLMASATAFAQDGSPPGCTANRLSVDIGRTPAKILDGGVVTYTIDIRNNPGGNTDACDIDQLQVTFTCPAADGTATGAATVVATGLSLPADGTADLVGHVELCTVDVDPGVSFATAFVVAGDPVASTPPFDQNFGRLLIGGGDEGMAVEKSVSVQVTSCEIDLTKCVAVDTNGDGDVDDEVCGDAATGLIGDVVGWSIQVINDGPGQAEQCTLSDPTLGIIDQPVANTELVPEAGICDAALTENTATVTCNACDGIATTLQASASATLECIDCEVQIDKQVSCDGGNTWVDAGLVLNNNDGTNGCTAFSDEAIMVRWQVSNTGEGCDLTSCQATESNAIFGPAPGPLDLADGQSTPLTGGNSALCADAYGDPGNPNEPNVASVTCDAEVGPPVSASDTASFSCVEVDLLVDRNVDCGTGANDEQLVAANEDGTDGCTALDGDPVTFGYQVCNNGTAPLYACRLVDQNTDVSLPIDVGDLAPGECPVPQVPTGSPVDCSDQLEAGELPDNGRVDLTCCIRDVADLTSCEPADRVSVWDASTVTCDSPSGLQVVKECIDDDGDGTDDRVSVTASATPAGDLGFTACTPTDTIYFDDPTCPPVGAGTDIPLVTAGPYDLAPGASETSFGTIAPTLTANACNTAEVTCTGPDGAPVTSTAAPVVCEFTGEGCLTRTPGFWGNRPNITEQYLSLDVCGTELSNTEIGDTHSAIEAICSVGKDGKILGSQKTQLVRQCTAAALNLAVTADEGGFCGGSITEVFGSCCGAESACTDVDAGYSVNECIGMLDEFNNSEDTLSSDVFTRLGRANSYNCRNSRNNEVVVTPGSGPTPAP